MTQTDIRTIKIPETVFASADSLEDLEDWLLSHDASFLEHVRRIRREQHLAGKGKPLSEILQRWPTEAYRGF